MIQLIENSSSNNNSRNSSSINEPSLATTILGSIGLTPLIHALAGFIHEVHPYLSTATATTNLSAKKIFRWLWVAQLQIHAVAATGIVLVIIGSVQLVMGNSIPTANQFRSVGAVLVLLLCLALGLYNTWLVFQCHRNRTRRSQNVLKLAEWSLLAVIFLVVKVVYAVAYTFDHADIAISPITGSFAVKVAPAVGVNLMAAVAMVWAGWMSADIVRDHSCNPAVDDSEVVSYERVIPQKRWRIWLEEAVNC